MAGIVKSKMPQVEDANDNAQYVAALKFAMQALYENGGAEDVAHSLSKANNIVDGLSNTAYEIMAIVDERSNGAVPDDFFGLLGINVLQEVADIATAAHIQLKPAEIALALKQMILRYLGEQGYNTQQMQAAMDKVNPDQFNQMAQGDQK